MTQDEHRQLAATEKQLLAEFGPALGEDLVRFDVSEVVRQFEAAPVRTYLPVLVLRQSRERLRRLAGSSAA